MRKFSISKHFDFISISQVKFSCILTFQYIKHISPHFTTYFLLIIHLLFLLLMPKLELVTIVVLVVCDFTGRESSVYVVVEVIVFIVVVVGVIVMKIRLGCLAPVGGCRGRHKLRGLGRQHRGCVGRRSEEWHWRRVRDLLHLLLQSDLVALPQ